MLVVPFLLILLFLQLSAKKQSFGIAWGEMEKESNQENNPSLLVDESPRKPQDRLKRDEWSEGAVSCLLESYESKWILRNRAKLKGQDWEDVARHVSCRMNGTKSPKTQTQCKNKIESMKKRYRSESAAPEASSWPLYSRLDLLLRGSAMPQPQPQPQQAAAAAAPRPSGNAPLMMLEPKMQAQQNPVEAANSSGSNDVDKVAKVWQAFQEDEAGNKASDQSPDKMPLDSDSSTPALYSDKDNKLRSQKMKMKMEKQRKRKREEMEIAESIRWLAEVVVRSEQARMDALREIEKMRVEAEAKRGELDLKRTEIIANTQLEIAKLFAGIGKNVDSSLRIGRN